MVRIGERVMAVITSRTVDGLLDTNTRTSEHAGRRTGDASALEDARFIAEVLVSEGFELLNFHPIAISFAGSPSAFKRLFGLKVIATSFAGGRGRRIDGFDILPEDSERLSSLPACFEGRAARMAIARPSRLTADDGTTVRDIADSDLPVWSLPDELAISTWADGTDAPSASGRRVVVAQIGTGHYRHRFFSDRGYKVLPTLLGPGQCHPQRDDHGHSTGEAACLFSGAPDLRLRPIKGLLDPIGDLLMAVDSTPTPDLIVNSWGYDVDQKDWGDLERQDPNLFHYLKILEMAITFASRRGIVVCASAPRTWKSFPACHPDVIAIAATSNGRAMQQASRGLGASTLYPGCHLPDLWSDAAKSVRSGLDLIGCIHPAQPGSVLARPGLHEAGSDESFAWCDIELAAAPLAAARIALLIEENPGLSTAGLKAMMTGLADSPKADQGDTRSRPVDGLPEIIGEPALHLDQARLGSLAG